MGLDSGNVTVHVEKGTTLENNVFAERMERAIRNRKTEESKELLIAISLDAHDIHTPLILRKSIPSSENVIIWELSYIIYLTRYTKSLYPEYQMDTIRYHGSSETRIIYLLFYLD